LEGVTDDFVQGIMPPDIFPERQEIALPVKEGGGMQTAGGVENTLALPEERG
jgi:hypothetical protein